MKEIFFSIFIFCAFGVSTQGTAKMVTASGGASPDIMDRLLNRPKIKRADAVLKDFLEKDSATTRVIVNLRETETLDTQAILEKPHKREYVANRIHNFVNGILQGFSSAQVQKTRSFKYMAGFSAQVTLEGLESLAENPDVLSIEKDVLLYPNLAQGIPLMNASAARVDL